MNGTLVIRAEREKPIVNRHPWVFSGAIDSIKGSPQPGDLVTLVNGRGSFLARGYYNPKSQIAVRILTWQDEAIDDDWWRGMLRRAVAGRFEFTEIHTENTAYRLVNAENDYLPGLVIDRYGDWLVLQALTLGIDRRKQLIGELAAELCQPRGIYERSDVDVRNKEGLKPTSGLLDGEEPPELIQIEEHGVKFLVDVRKGHKTGFYLDQRDNRLRLRKVVEDLDSTHTHANRVLNLFSYTGGFGLNASIASGVAGVTNVDASYEVLELAEQTVALNNPDWLERHEFIQADVFDYLRDQRDEGQQYAVIVCDPPKFAQSAQQVERAARGYKDLNLNCFKLLKPGGYLMTFSCSGAVSADLFQKIVFGALADSGRQAQILRHLGPGNDHPVALTFPEGTYLKGLLLRVY